MRSVVPFSNWWNVGSCASVAEYSSTGIDTRPNEITPDQIARAMLTAYPPHRGTSHQEESDGGQSTSSMDGWAARVAPGAMRRGPHLPRSIVGGHEWAHQTDTGGV